MAPPALPEPDLPNRYRRDTDVIPTRYRSRFSEVGRRPALGLAPLHEGRQFLVDSRIHRRRLKACDDVLKDLMRPLRGPDSPRRLPCLIVGPVTQEGLVEGRGIAVLGVLNAEVMTLIAHLAHRLEGDFLGAGRRQSRVHIALNML